MTTPDQNAQFQAFLAWQASQSGATAAPSGPTPDETPKPTLADVLKALVHRAGLPDENTVRAYSDVIDDYFAATEEPTPQPEPQPEPVA